MTPYVVVSRWGESAVHCYASRAPTLLPNLPACLPVCDQSLGESIDATQQETGQDEHHNALTTWGFFFPSTFYSHLYRNYFTEPEPTVNNRRLYHMSTKGR